ncbi:hypothetical protein A6395_01060 [Exiguobacterium sp. SH31]|uniref:hypothetical protein n=1 Tax=Exiguobacterium TaxID=33986 RepID=UPI00039ADD18|nr:MULTISPECIES: hypothetical protein [Exiguobacterium]OGX80539.1 hypothetical protein A6395_01060 [Exiguobacterium sp. SH31]TCI72851.1 hypothetical protein EVJ22_00135 [Exiguobacterium sp. SH0S7]
MDLFILMQERAVPLLVLTFFLVLNLAFLIGVWKKRINFSKLFLLFASSLAVVLMISSVMLITFTLFVGYNQ